MLVELSERPVEVKDSFANGFIYKDKNGYLETEYLDEYCDDSKILGLLSDLTEEQFAEWVKQGLGLYANYNETVEFGTVIYFLIYTLEELVKLVNT